MTTALDEIYVDASLASLYDILNPPGEDTAFYLSLPSAGSTILDIGCGTGLLAAALAEQGHRVVGIDPSSTMLEIARTRPGGEHVDWFEADARSFNLETSFDLILMTGHVFQVFLSDDDVRRALANARRHLNPGGRLVFESRNPSAKAWESWTPAHSRKTVVHPTLGHVETWHELGEVEPGTVSFSSFAQIHGQSTPLISHSTLTFRSLPEIEALLEAGGFHDRRWIGGWDGAPLDADSPEIIVIAS